MKKRVEGGDYLPFPTLVVWGRRSRSLCCGGLRVVHAQGLELIRVGAGFRFRDQVIGPM